MKNTFKIWFLILIVLCIRCTRIYDPLSSEEKLFSYKNVPELNLTNIDNYWDDTIKIDTSYYMGADFEQNPNFSGGIRFFSQNGKAVWVSVFKSRDDAVSAMKARIKDVACIIKTGDPNEFETLWWYSECLGYAVFFNQHNTIIEINFSSNAPFEGIKGILLEVAKEIEKRIDSLSEYQ